MPDHAPEERPPLRLVRGDAAPGASRAPLTPRLIRAAADAIAAEPWAWALCAPPPAPRVRAV